MPFGVVRWYKSRYPQSQPEVMEEPPRCELDENFMSGYRRYLNADNKVEFAKQSPFLTVVTVQGFGYSGSGAVVDLLREYDTNLVIGSVDYEGSVATRDKHCEEIDILRLAGGLFEVEKYIGSNNIFQNDALLHRVVAHIEYSEIYRAIPETRPYFYEYMSRISELLTDSPEVQYYNRSLDYKGNNDVFYLKEMTLKEYRTLCNGLLNSLFAIIKGESKAPIFVLDQSVNDFEFDTARYLDYIPNLKIIMVCRDPRDVFAFARESEVGWIPNTSVESFVQWNKIITRHFDIHERHAYLVVRFEDLIESYNEEVTAIENYIGIESASHTMKGTCLDVSVSQKNIGIWKNDVRMHDAYKRIFDQLVLYCYNG